jgi:serine/threonine-protein kinase
MEDLSGKQLGPYQIAAPLGEGGMAAVYRAYQASMDRYVALKILPRYFASDPEFIGRFEREAKVIAKFQHPHILPVFDYGQEDGYTYIVMPFVEGGTLADLLEGHPVSLSQIQRAIAQVGDALDYAHSQGVIHRDVKPSNILIDPSGNCLLADFGVAKIVESTAQFTRAGGTFGTPAYMSPEQIEGEELDGRSDVYSLGIVLYEMATGHPPYRAKTPPAIFVKHLVDPPPPPRTLNPALPEAVEQVTLRALAKDREERYATAGDMVQALQAATEPAALSADSSGVLEEPPAALNQPHYPTRRWILVGCGAAIAVIGIVIVVGVVGLSALASRLFGTPPYAVETGAAARVTVTTESTLLAEKQATHTVEAVALTAPRVEANATARAAPAAQTEPTSMAVARATAFASAVVVFEDDFSSSANGWWQGESSDEYGDYIDRIIDDRFRKSVVSKQPAWNWSWIPNFSAGDFWLSVEVTIIEVSGKPGDAQIAITFRENENDEYYDVEFANDGTYSVWLDKDGEWSRLQEWMPSDAVKLEPGVTNTFDLLVMGSSFTLYANGQELNTVNDIALGDAGQISLAIGLEKAGQTLTVEFDNLVIKELPN